MTKLLVTGPRTMENDRFVYAVLDVIKDLYGFDEVIVGDATGVDEITRSWCEDHYVPCKVCEAEWEKYRRPKGKNPAGVIRNKEMVKICDKGIGIWDGKSRGTKHCIGALREAKKLLMVFRYE